jgi:hypothetical protein
MSVHETQKILQQFQTDSIAQLLAAGQARRHKRQAPPIEMDSTRMIRDDRDQFDRSLPSIEEIEAELSRDLEEEV